VIGGVVIGILVIGGVVIGILVIGGLGPPRRFYSWLKEIFNGIVF
jgi:hypothetical protein